ncbi:hypothetical protein BDQ12DRAFT_732250 [Crucibulum laeve]|uniref:Uncharacterized protein n=1 Tax=Crucibulum laeve TaxID=68775 RepID=A0A5C3MBP4_9AGAR|nr:hypothetical protein BDQ12DRAFT_732250 [Crucibulum laeve]
MLANPSRAGLPNNPRSRVAGPSRLPSSNDSSRGRSNDFTVRQQQSSMRPITPSQMRNPHRTRISSRPQTQSPSRTPYPSYPPTRTRTPSPTRPQLRSRAPSRPPTPSRAIRDPKKPVRPDIPNIPSLQRPRTAGSSYRSDDSASSISSAASSLFERRNGSNASSRTSLETDDAGYKQEADYDDTPVKNHKSESQDTTSQNSGYAIWSRVADVATALTVNVSKAWAANVSTLSGEDTPAGEESRLTRTMKAYHASKARDPSDLPEWLFSEKERGIGLRDKNRRRDDEGYEPSELSSELPKKPSVVSRPSTPSRLLVTSQANDAAQTAPPRGADRLKAMRDARRNVENSTSTISKAHIKDVYPDDTQRPERTSRRTPLNKTGLPSRPGPRVI